ncbi:MAG: FtsX-like permease family protein [Bacillota bacterium]|jgi:ABC-type lipoprotein release transport system permease subunit
MAVSKPMTESRVPVVRIPGASILMPAPWLFFLRNKAKSIPLFMLVSLSVVVIVSVGAMTDSVLTTAYRSSVRFFEQASTIVSKQAGIESDLVERVALIPSVGSMIPFLDSAVRVEGLLGSEPRHVLAVRACDADSVLNALGLTVRRGRLPEPGMPEIAIHEDIAKSRKTRIGSVIGREVDPRDYLWGAFVVSGILSGEAPICIASLDYFEKQWMASTGDQHYAYIVFPKAGELRSANDALSCLPDTAVSIATIDTEMQKYRSEYANTRLFLWITDLLVVVIVSVAMGLVNTIYFHGRLREFVLMAATGRTSSQLLARVMSEVLALASVGYCAGLAVAQMVLWALSAGVFSSRGIAIEYVSLRSAALAAPVPVLLSMFSTATIGYSLYTLDFVSIMEGKDSC